MTTPDVVAQAEAQIAAAMGGTEGAAGFLGVPDGYAVQRPLRNPASPRQGDLTEVAGPRYTEADLFTPRQTLSPEDIARLQAEMARAGLYGKRPRYVNGRWDEASISAYEKLLRYANQGAVDEREALAELGTGTVDLDGDGQLDPVSGMADPKEARQMLRKAMRERLGRSPRREEYEAFVASLTAQSEGGPELGLPDDDEPTPIGVMVGEDPESAEGDLSLADEYVGEQFGTEEASFQTATTWFDRFMDVIGG